MARKKSEFVSAGYKMVKVFEALANGVLDAGGGDDDLRKLETDSELRFAVGKLIVGDRDCFRFTNDEVVIQIPALPRPTLEVLTARYPLIVSIERDDSPECPVTLRLATVLKSDEDSIDGPTYEQRLASRRSILLGLQHRDWLVAHQDELPEAARTALRALIGNVYMDFPGLIVVRGDGGRGFPYAARIGRRWSGGWGWIDDGFGRLGRVAVSSK